MVSRPAAPTAIALVLLVLTLQASFAGLAWGLSAFFRGFTVSGHGPPAGPYPAWYHAVFGCVVAAHIALIVFLGRPGHPVARILTIVLEGTLACILLIGLACTIGTGFFAILVLTAGAFPGSAAAGLCTRAARDHCARQPPGPVSLN